MSKVNTDQLWVIYDYEVNMFKQMLWIGTTPTECQKFPPPVQNAIVESMLLHLRILVDILLSRGAGSDDINLTDLLPGFKSHLIDQLKTTYGNRTTVGSPYWTLNKRLAHPSDIRSSGYNYDHLLKELLPVGWPLLEEIAQAR